MRQQNEEEKGRRDAIRRSDAAVSGQRRYKARYSGGSGLNDWEKYGKRWGRTDSARQLANAKRDDDTALCTTATKLGPGIVTPVGDIDGQHRKHGRPLRHVDLLPLQ
jgi:hypothetical protein